MMKCASPSFLSTQYSKTLALIDILWKRIVASYDVLVVNLLVNTFKGKML